MTKEKDLKVPDQAKAEKEAIAWFTRMNGNPSHADKRNFQAWQRLHERNADAYHSISVLWSSSAMPGSDIAREETSALAVHLARIEEIRTRKKNRGKTATGVLAFLLIFCGGWVWLNKPNLIQDISADYVTARGETRQISLNDGSSILLDADTAIDVQLDDDIRHITLLRGAAFFEVKPSSVPFIVEAANGRSRVLGTAFDVAMNNEGVEVVLQHGSLQVEIESLTGRVVLKPGESVKYTNTDLAMPHNIDLGDALSWHEGRFVFNNTPLKEVLQKIERYRNGRIVLVDSALGERRISGSFSLRDTNSALSSLQASVGFNIHKLGERLVLIGP